VPVGAAPVTKEFSVHKVIKCSRSQFLREAIPDKEIVERVIALTEVESRVILTYVDIRGVSNKRETLLRKY
jgi:hypothetical protein